MTGKTKTVNGWAIVGTSGLYTGWWLTKRDAIEEHCKALRWADLVNQSGDIKAEWAECQEDGDRVVKVQITYDKCK